MNPKNYNITLKRAIEIAANHNCVTVETASAYTITELKEVLKHLKIKAKIHK